MENETRIKRWRLILGAESEDSFSQIGGSGMTQLAGDELLMDQALAAIYHNTSEGGFGGGSFGKGGGRGPSQPVITKWMGDVRSLFAQDVVKIIQTDAV